jgi:hypothetical protein
MVLAISGTLTFLLLDIEPARCQNGTVSGRAAVSLSDVPERLTDRAASLSDEDPTGLFDEGQSWYLETAWGRFVVEGLLIRGALGTFVSLVA